MTVKYPLELLFFSSLPTDYRGPWFCPAWVTGCEHRIEGIMSAGSRLRVLDPSRLSPPAVDQYAVSQGLYLWLELSVTWQVIKILKISNCFVLVINSPFVSVRIFFWLYFSWHTEISNHSCSRLRPFDS